MAGEAAMIAQIETYLAMRRAAGFELTNEDYLLRSFARFAAAQGETHIRTATTIDWASQTSSVAQRDRRLKCVCQFARYIRLEDAHHELPPADHFGYRKTRRIPYLYSCIEINRLIEAALQLDSPPQLKSQTYPTLIALLAATGLRISEALALRFADLTCEGLLIRKTKFRKTRLVPLHETARAGLERYLSRRRQISSPEDYVFITDDGQAVPYGAVHRTFKKLLKTARLWPAPDGRWPRLHDLRHVFAVNALQACPPERAAISQHMLALATYLGHVNIYSTYWYLEATPELLRGIAVACESFFEGELP
jgi:integrase